MRVMKMCQIILEYIRNDFQIWFIYFHMIYVCFLNIAYTGKNAFLLHLIYNAYGFIKNVNSSLFILLGALKSNCGCYTFRDILNILFWEVFIWYPQTLHLLSCSYKSKAVNIHVILECLSVIASLQTETTWLFYYHTVCVT
jgi:hypothetical protein